jgi:hypothetical protein
VVLVRTYVSEEFITYIMRVTKIGELGTTLAVTRQPKQTAKNNDDGGDKFLENVGYCRSQTT